MIYLILVVAAAIMVAPLLLLRPSPRERRLMKLRTKAMELGLKVDCSGVKLFKWAQENRLIDPTRIARYSIIIDPQEFKDDDFRPFQGTYFRWLYRGAEEWQWHEVSAHQLDKIPQLMDWLEKVKTSSLGVVAIELGFKNCSIFWHEEGGEDAVDEIKSHLHALCEIIINEIKRSNTTTKINKY